MPHLVQSCAVCIDNKDITIVAPSQDKNNTNALFISFWCYFTKFNAKYNQNILSLKKRTIFDNKPTFNNINIKIDHENSHRLKIEIDDNINIPIQSKTGLSIYSWNHIAIIITCNPLTILIKLNDEYFQHEIKQNGIIYNTDISNYKFIISSSSSSGFNGLFGSFLSESFILKHKLKYLKEKDYKQKYLNILIEENIEQNTNFILNINNINYGYGNHNKLSVTQCSLLNIKQLLEHKCDDILNKSKQKLTFCKWENMFIDDVINGYKTNKIKSLSPPKHNLMCVCHDMAGGYHHDNYSFGYHIFDDNQLPFEYFIEYWSIIDIFIYFSHDFITIPPIQWIENAHKFNTLILGTIITEHEYGTILTHKMIDNSIMRKKIVKKLVEIALFYGFDGWFLNFESNLKQSESINNLILFVRELKNELNKYLPYGKIIWYDSVNYENGKIEWQSKLNQKNIPFFNECDGIFTDYHWKKEFPLQSIQFASKTNREYAVFTGIDIWGRGTFGDGGYKSQITINYLLNEINKINNNKSTSIGLFATAWTFEHEIEIDSKHRKSLNDDYCSDYFCQLFRTNERKFWLNKNYLQIKLNNNSEWNANKIGGNDGWKIIKNDDCWVSSYKWCIRQINVDLNKKFDINLLNNNKQFIIRIKQSVKGTGPNFKDLYQIIIEFKNYRGDIIKRIDEGQIILSQEWKHLCWQYHVTDNNKITNIVITEKAKDIEYWAGHFGAKLSSPIITLLFNQTDNNNNNNDNISIVNAIKQKNNKCIYGHDTYFYFNPNSNENKLFWCNTFNLGFGKKYINPSLNDLNIKQEIIASHSWTDLSMQDFNDNVVFNNNDNNYNQNIDDFDDEMDEELRKAIAMSMISETKDNNDDDNDDNRYSNNNYYVRSCFDDAFYGGHCLEFQSRDIFKDGKIFKYPLHCILQNKYIDNKSLISISFATKQSNKECLLYLTINYIDSCNISHCIKCKNDIDKNNILMLCGYNTKKYQNGWILHNFDFKMNQNDKIKFTSINANILAENKSIKHNLWLGYISILIEPINDSKLNEIDDEKQTNFNNKLIIDNISTINKKYELDDIIKIDYSTIKNNIINDFQRINVYLIKNNIKINDDINNKWINSLLLQQYLGDKTIENIEWLSTTKVNKKQLLINNSIILSIIEKWNKNENNEYLLLFEMSDLKIYKNDFSKICKWCVLRLKNLV